MNRPDETMKPTEVLQFLKEHSDYYKSQPFVKDIKKVKASNSITFRKFIDNQEIRHLVYGYLFLFPGAVPIELKTMTDEYHLAIHDWMNVQPFTVKNETVFLPCNQFVDELNWIVADAQKAMKTNC